VTSNPIQLHGVFQWPASREWSSRSDRSKVKGLKPWERWDNIVCFTFNLCTRINHAHKW
jgi:hypothetical protein